MQNRFNGSLQFHGLDNGGSYTETDLLYNVKKLE